MRKIYAVALIAGGLSLVAPAARAQENHHAFRIHLDYFSSTSDINVNYHDTDTGTLITSKNQWKNGFGAGASYEYRANPLIGVELGARYFRPDLALSNNREVKKTQFLPATLGLNFHLGHSKGFDLYLGPQIAYVWYGRIDVPLLTGGTARVDVKNEFTWGGKLGIDIPLGDKLALTFAADYLAAKAKVENDPNVINHIVTGPSSYNTNPRPVMISGGLTFRY